MSESTYEKKSMQLLPQYSSSQPNNTMTSWKKYRYDNIEENGSAPLPRLQTRKRIHIFYGILMTVIAFVSYNLGLQNATFDQNRSPLYEEIQLQTVSRKFTPNVSFVVDPSEGSDQAWKDIMPRKGGYIRHPTLAPEDGTVAVFHQLHCLNAIREHFPGMYTYNPSQQSKRHEGHAASSPHASHHHEKEPFHMQHCIELIRQALMCQPDLAVERFDHETMGTTGFGTEHQCVDWNQLVEWVDMNDE